MKSTAISILVSMLLATSAFAVGEARIQLSVVDAQGNPIEGAKATVTATEKRTWEQTYESNSEGLITVLVIDGTIPYKFHIEKQGYAAWEDVIKMKLIPEKNFQTVTLVPPMMAGPSLGAAEGGEPDPARVAYNEGVALLKDGKESEAITSFQKSLELDPSLVPAHAALATIEYRLEQWPAAIEHANAALDLGGDDQNMFAILSFAYEKVGNKEKAREFRAKAPANASQLFNDAVPLLNAGKDAEAEQLLLQAIQADDTFALAHYELGSVYARAGKIEKARQHLSRYLELEPNGDQAAIAKEMLKYLK